MESIQLHARLKQGNGYRYFIIPADALSVDHDVRIQVTFNGKIYTTVTRMLQDGTHMVIINRETEMNYELSDVNALDVNIQRIDAAPQLMDLSEDFLAALSKYAIQEDFKRLPPSVQRDCVNKIGEAPDQRSRMERIEEVVRMIQAKDKDLPRGASL